MKIKLNICDEIPTGCWKRDFKEQTLYKSHLHYYNLV